MLLSLNWLGKYVPVQQLDSNEIARKLTLHTAEIEEVIEKGAELDQVLIAEVQEVQSIKPGYGFVTISTGKTHKVICTDTTLKAGDKIPYAPLGTVFNGQTTGTKTIDGFTSEGFVMSEKELDISTDESVVFRIDDPRAKPGMKLTELYPFLKDTLLKLDNKSVTHRPDLWGIYGFARELSAIYKLDLEPLDTELELKPTISPAPVITLEKNSGCNRYQGIIIKNISNGLAPLEIRTLLHYSGYQTLNLVVDLANYVMVETGQPLHTFDYDQIGHEIVVDRAKETVHVKTLDGETAAVPQNAVLIQNKNRQPIAVAGVIGGDESKIIESTSAVLLESANFDAASIRITANSMKRRTEASNRFEKSLTPALTETGLKRFCTLLGRLQQQVAFSAVADVDVSNTNQPEISFRLDFARKFSGVEFDPGTISDILNRLGFQHTYSNETYNVKVPWYRSAKDISTPPDLMEEIARIYGYDNIVPLAPAFKMAPVLPNTTVETEYHIRRVMSYVFGFVELRTYAWHDNRWLSQINYQPQNTVRLVNPRSVFQDQMKDTLVPALLELAELNMRHHQKAGMYELSSIFRQTDVAVEKKSFAGVLYQKDGNLPNLFFSVKEAIGYTIKGLKNAEIEFRGGYEGDPRPWINKTSSVSVYVQGNYLGYISPLSARLGKKFFNDEPVVVFELDVDAIRDIQPVKLSYLPPPQFPSVKLEFNIVAAEREKYNRILEVVNSFRNPYIKQTQFKEFYRDEKRLPGKTSYLFMVEIGSDEKTLDSNEINQFKDQFIGHIQDKGLSLR